ncbi:unnamed protein product [Staurois parvus]|uniref:Uncharacterized protein n=1 Tax=Staurois parvus TaxID=386267 RepID=A0ABN9EXC8_9NEOB|nr:unnamed protein product [Staurois parvus]
MESSPMGSLVRITLLHQIHPLERSSIRLVQANMFHGQYLLTSNQL